MMFWTTAEPRRAKFLLGEFHRQSGEAEEDQSETPRPSGAAVPPACAVVFENPVDIESSWLDDLRRDEHEGIAYRRNRSIEPS